MRAGVVAPALVSGGASETERYIQNACCYDRSDAHMLRGLGVMADEGAQETSTHRQTRKDPKRDRSGKSYLYIGVSRGMLGLCAALHRADPVVYHRVHASPPMRLGTC
jgi:hypothetical protein